MKAKRWHLSGLFREVELPEVFAGTCWAEEAEEYQRRERAAILGSDREYLDGPVPLEMVVYGLAVTGQLAYRSGSTLRSWRHDPDAEPVPLAWVAATYGSAVAEEILEKGSVTVSADGPYASRSESGDG